MRPCLIVSMLAALSCDSAPEPPQAPRSRPNILLVTLDTVRADHTSLHGYERDTTPFLAELAGQGIRFDRAYATSSWTVPSIASVLTSLEPSAHGLVYGFIEHDKVVDQQVLSGAHRSLAEQLSDAGYRTAAVTSNGHLAAAYGFAQGFDRYINHGFADAALMRNQVESFSGFLKEAEPWFLWVHLFDPHAPYEARDMTRSYLAEERYVDTSLLADLQGILDTDRLVERGIEPGDRSHRYLNALYDGEIRHTDDYVRAIVGKLGLGEDDIIVVTADHGEEFFDHGGCGHGHSLFEETIRVPLVLRLPGHARAGTAVGHPVSLIDVMPTILEAAGIDVPAAVQGQGLFDVGRPIRTSVAKIDAIEALIDPRFKYIHDIDNGKHMLFDIQADPGETTNLLGPRAEVAAAMRQRLTRWILDRPEYIADASPLTEEHVAMLRSLGYVN